MSTEPFYDFMNRHLSIRERELCALKDEYAFLQTCGGVSSEEMTHFRASVLRFTRTPTTIVIKDEPDDESPALISLKSMILDVITTPQADNINKICRHIRPLLDREGIRTFCRHHATHVRSADLPRIVAVLQKEGIA